MTPKPRLVEHFWVPILWGLLLEQTFACAMLSLQYPIFARYLFREVSTSQTWHPALALSFGGSFLTYSWEFFLLTVKLLCLQSLEALIRHFPIVRRKTLQL